MPALFCQAKSSVGLHDWPGGGEHYDPSVFIERAFRVTTNQTLTSFNAKPGEVDLFVTLTQGDETVELRCKEVRGRGSEYGYSCTDSPPAQMLLINQKNWRYTRSGIGGWVCFGAASEELANGGEATSLYVELGQCRKESIKKNQQGDAARDTGAGVAQPLDG